MFYKSLFLLLALCLTGCLATKKITENKYSSPGDQVHLSIRSENEHLGLDFKFLFEEVNVILENCDPKILSIETKEVKNSWTPLFGEISEVPDNYIEISLATKDKAGRNLKINCRLYDEALALQYIYGEEDFKDEKIELESIHWSFQGDYKTWIAHESQGEYKESKLSFIEKPTERPLLVQANENIFFALGEAAVVDYPRSKFILSEKSEYALTLAPESSVDLKKAQYTSPWRYILVGDSPGAILENNYILSSLNAENQIKDESWIRPGKIIREVTLTTEGGIACVDFAASNGLQFVEFDAGWYGDEYSKVSDASTITVDPNRSKGPLDLHHVISYAKKRDIGIILYVNNNAMLKQLDQILPLYKEWGIAGVKYGFVNTGSQEWNLWLHEAIRKAAENELMVDIHDDYRPTGYSRTYPNLMTQEGVRGDEETPSVQHSLYTIFIRGIAGAADNTNCYLAPRVKEKLGGKAAQMAKSVMIYSPWQFLYWYDRPEASPRKKGGAGASESILVKDEGFKFYAGLPTIWDETKVLDAKMGEYGTIARRSGSNWYIGSLNANSERTLKLDLDFLDTNGSYDATIYYQDVSAQQENKIIVQEKVVSNDWEFQQMLPANSGLVLVLVRK